MSVVERPQARQVELEARPHGSEPPLNLDQSRLDPDLGGQDPLEPATQRGHIRPRRIHVMLAYDVQGAISLGRPEVPVGAVGQDPDISLLELVAASRHVAGELLEASLSLAAAPENPLELEDGQPALDVDASTRAVCGRHLAPDDAVVVEIEAAVPKQGRDVRLQVGFAAVRGARGDAPDEVIERYGGTDGCIEGHGAEPIVAQRGASVGSPAASAALNRRSS